MDMEAVVNGNTEVFDVPTGNLFIEALSGDDTITIQSVAPGYNQQLTVDAGGGIADSVNIGEDGGSGTITFDGNLTVINATDVDVWQDLTLEGTLRLEASSTIEVKPEVTIRSEADVHLNVDANITLDFLAFTPNFRDIESSATVDIGTGAQLFGDSIEITADSTNEKFASFLADIVGLQDATETLVATYTAQLGAELEFLEDGQFDTITRTGTGSFVDDGFEDGALISVANSAGNNGTFQVLSVEDKVITLDDVDPAGNPQGLVDETSETATVAASIVEDLPLLAPDPNVGYHPAPPIPMTGIPTLTFDDGNGGNATMGGRSTRTPRCRAS